MRRPSLSRFATLSTPLNLAIAVHFHSRVAGNLLESQERLERLRRILAELLVQDVGELEGDQDVGEAPNR